MESSEGGKRKTVTVDGNKMLSDNKLVLLCFIFVSVFLGFSSLLGRSQPSRALRAFFCFPKSISFILFSLNEQNDI